MRRILDSLWVLVALLAVFSSGVVRSETIPATNQTTYANGTASYLTNCSSDGALNVSGATVDAAKAACVSFYGSCDSWTSWTGTSNGNQNIAYAKCPATTGATRGVYLSGTGTCPAGYSNFDKYTTQCSKVELSCPANQGWALSGSNCTRSDCEAGFTRNAETGLCYQNCGSGDRSPYDQVNASVPGAQCVAGCMYSQSSATCYGGSCLVTLGGGTGSACASGATSSPAATTTEASCESQGKGWSTVNGTTTCASASPDNPVTKYENKTTTGTNPDGSPTSGGGASGVSTQDGGSSVSRTTTNPDGSTTTTTTSKDLFCEENPNAEVCKGGSAFCKENPENVLCRTPGAAVKTETFANEDANVSEGRQVLADRLTEMRAEASTLVAGLTVGSGSLPCPAPVVVLGRAISMCASKYEDQLRPLGAVVMLMAGIIAATMMFRN